MADAGGQRRRPLTQAMDVTLEAVAVAAFTCEAVIVAATGCATARRDKSCIGRETMAEGGGMTFSQGRLFAERRATGLGSVSFFIRTRGRNVLLPLPSQTLEGVIALYVSISRERTLRGRSSRWSSCLQQSPRSRAFFGLHWATCAFCCCTTVEYERKVRKGQESKVLPHCSWTAPHGWLIRCNVPPCIELFPLVMALPSAVDTRVLIVGW